jgi:hypothetical protein
MHTNVRDRIGAATGAAFVVMLFVGANSGGRRNDGRFGVKQ